MKNTFYCGLLAAALFGITGCADRDDRRDDHAHMSSSTTTTEETHVRQPVQQTTTVETERQ